MTDTQPASHVDVEYTALITSRGWQVAQLMRTNPRDAFRGQSRSPNSSIPYVRYSFLLCNSNFVFKTFDFKKCRDLEMRVRGHSRSLKVAPFDRLYMVSYWSSLVRLFLKRTVFEIFDFKNAMTLKTGLVVRQGHWKCHRATERIWIPIDFL